VYVNQTNLNGKLRKNWGGAWLTLESPQVQIKVTITNHDFGPDYKLH